MVRLWKWGVLVLLACWPPAAVAQDAWCASASSYTYRRKIAFTTQITSVPLGGGTPTTGFPILVQLTPSTFTYAHALASLNDVRFCDPDGTPLNYERENVAVGGTSNFWVGVPTVDNGTADYFYLYYGNAAAADGQNAVGVWDNNYISVWHMADAAGPTITDSKGGHNFTAVGGPTFNQDASIGKGVLFVRSSSQYAQQVLPVAFKTAAVTTEAIVSLTSNDSQVILAGDPLGAWGDSRGAYLSVGGVVVGTKGVGGAFQSAAGATSIATGVAKHLSAVIQTSGIEVFLNGASDGINSNGSGILWTDVPTGIGPSPAQVYIGGYNSNVASSAATTLFSNALLDELRWSNIARSPQWLLASYRTELQNGTYQTYGSEEVNGPPATSTVPPTTPTRLPTFPGGTPPRCGQAGL